MSIASSSEDSKSNKVWRWRCDSYAEQSWRRNWSDLTWLDHQAISNVQAPSYCVNERVRRRGKETWTWRRKILNRNIVSRKEIHVSSFHFHEQSDHRESSVKAVSCSLCPFLLPPHLFILHCMTLRRRRHKRHMRPIGHSWRCLMAHDLPNPSSVDPSSHLTLTSFEQEPFAANSKLSSAVECMYSSCEAEVLAFSLHDALHGDICPVRMQTAKQAWEERFSDLVDDESGALLTWFIAESATYLAHSQESELKQRRQGKRYK